MNGLWNIYWGVVSWTIELCSIDGGAAQHGGMTLTTLKWKCWNCHHFDELPMQPMITIWSIWWHFEMFPFQHHSPHLSILYIWATTKLLQLTKLTIMCVFSEQVSLLMIVRIYSLHLIIIMKLRSWEKGMCCICFLMLLVRNHDDDLFHLISKCFIRQIKGKKHKKIFNICRPKTN